MPESVVSEVISFLKITSTLCAETAGLVRGADVRRVRGPVNNSKRGVKPMDQSQQQQQQQQNFNSLRRDSREGEGELM